MLMPASSEFISLCQSQVALLTRGLGAAFSIIYLTEELADAADAKLVPIVAYPEAVASWGEDQILSLLTQGPHSPSTELRSLASQPPDSPIALLPAQPPDLTELERAEPDPPEPLTAAEKALSQQQIVLPLVHESVVMGLLVTARADRAWNAAEQEQIEQIVETLSLGCVLDQRAQWMAQDLRQQRLMREQRRDLFDNLLHQFRNPLTAMRTFGKLLVKRIRPEDVNRTAAEGIVRESDRLQDLLKQFDAAVDLDETDLNRILSSVDEAELDTETLEADAENRSHTPPLLTAGFPPQPNLLVSSIQLAPHSLEEVLNPLLESAMAIAQDRQLTLRSHIPPNLPPVQTDSRALREVLSNLIDNALKYTPTGRQIEVIVQRQDNQQVIAILDAGAGIPSEDLAHLFERGYRGVQAQTAIPGTGLGLAIARDLIRRMQGNIQVFSPAASSGFSIEEGNTPSPGTAVVVHLPEAVPQERMPT
ncbi:HAMP domain-containing histidine kinase [Phormidium tenue FACHB-886]|nr:HAMP domain-containing histidine kinase [Phormidium tenue FACHB-886]